MARRCCCSCMEARSRSASRRSVMSSCVATQPPSCIGRLVTRMLRPSADLTSVLRVWPPCIEVASSTRYSSILREKVPCPWRYSSSAIQRRAGAHDLVRQLIHLGVAAVADDQPLMAVEHAQPLRHVVERDAHALVVRLQALRTDQDRGRHRRDRGQRGRGPVCQADPRSDRRDIMKERETDREAGAADRCDQAPIARNCGSGRSCHFRVRIGAHGIPQPVVLQLIAGA